MRKIYKAVFEGVILYAAPVRAPLLKYKKYRDILLRSQRSALILITKAFSTVANAALQVIAAIMPIDLTVEMRAALYLQRKGQGAYGSEKEARELFMNLWESIWTDGDRGEHTRKIWPSVADRLKALKHIKVDFFLTQAYSGHGRFNETLKTAEAVAVGKLQRAVQLRESGRGSGLGRSGAGIKTSLSHVLIKRVSADSRVNAGPVPQTGAPGTGSAK